jgi:hypothetical protein
MNYYLILTFLTSNIFNTNYFNVTLNAAVLAVPAYKIFESQINPGPPLGGKPTLSSPHILPRTGPN